MELVSASLKPRNLDGFSLGTTHVLGARMVPMIRTDLVDRLAALPSLEGIPREELEWLVARGEIETIESGTVVISKGGRVDRLYVVLEGRIAIRVDRGAGPRRVMEWRTGDVTGRLPYSRMGEAIGVTAAEERTRALSVHESRFPELIRKCPTFTASTVHLMLDRARAFNTSDLHDEKMVSLGRLAAGLAHELNNPASATARSAQLLSAGLDQTDETWRALCAAGLGDEAIGALMGMREACMASRGGNICSPLELADREDEIAGWLSRHGANPDDAGPLAETSISIDALEAVAKVASGDTLLAALRWLAVACHTRLLASDVEDAASRILELVTAVKRFTYMDSRSGPELVGVEEGLRDTMKVIASKANAKNAAVDLEIEPNLPLVWAAGPELNQVWLNLLDNALDAAPDGGRVAVRAGREGNHVVVRIVDDGPGIPPEALPRIFDPFFTTKPPGQGTGLGLDIARRIVRAYRGDIAAESHPGRTELRVSLAVEPLGRTGCPTA